MSNCSGRIRLIQIASVIVTVLFLLFGLWLHVSDQKNTFLNYSFNGAVGLLYMAIGIVSFIFFIFEKKFNQRYFFLSSAIGMVSWSIGSFVWSYYNFFLHVEVPYPSLGDVFFSLYNIFFAASYWFLINSVKLKITRSTLRDSFFLVVGIYILVFYVFYPPTYQRNLGVDVLAVNILYPLIDSFILALSFVVLRLSQGRFRSGALLLTCAFLLQISGDILFTYRNSRNIYWNGDVSDLLFMLSALFMVWGLIQIRMCRFGTTSG